MERSRQKMRESVAQFAFNPFLADSEVPRTGLPVVTRNWGFWLPILPLFSRAALGVLLGALCVNDAALSWCQVFGSNSQTSCFPKRIS